ncbi:hypothetical protein DPV78_006315 [Talaromyces pinophilus]|nr:hypothetical protein DPV78_006315 [Talaromyces pinophilus]
MYIPTVLGTRKARWADFETADIVEVDGHSSLEVQAFVNNIFDQYKNADDTLAKKLGALNLSNRRRLTEHSNVPKTDKPPETHVRVSGFNSVVTFEESDEQIYVPIPYHYGDDWSPNNNGSKIPRRKESNAYMPPAPWQVRLEAPFKCALCKKIVTLRGHEAWMVHVYADLKAYICIHPLCDQSFEYYHLWAEHVLTSHFPGLKRYCLFCDSEINSTDRTSTRNSFVEHLVHNHWDLSDTERTAATLDTERFIIAPFNSFPCGICRRKTWKTWFEFAAHMARHLEEISLAALPEEMYSLDESPAARKHRPKKRQPDAPKERPDALELSLNRKQHKHHEEEEESDLSEEDPDYVRVDRVDRELTKAPLPSVKKPHRGSLRPRKVHEKVKESKQDEDKQEEPTSSPHVKFEDKSRDQNHRKHSSHDPSPSKGKDSKGQPVQQYPNVDAMRSYYKAYQDQYEQQLKAGGQGYQGYGYPVAYAYSNSYGGYPYAREGYDYRVPYQGHVNDHANCRCQTCAAMREEYYGE